MSTAPHHAHRQQRDARWPEVPLVLVADLNGCRVAATTRGARDDDDHDDRGADELRGTKLAELTQRIDDQLAQAAGGAAIDYGALERRVADALGEVEHGLHAQILVRLDIDVPARSARCAGGRRRESRRC